MGTETASAAHTTMPAHVWTLVPVLASLMMNITVSVHLASLATTALKVRDTKLHIYRVDDASSLWYYRR